MIRLNDIEIRRDDDTSLTDRPVTLRVEPGHLVGIAGVSDVAKTQLLRVIAGELAPDHGTVEGTPEPSDLAWIPQDNHLSMALTALENVAVPLIAAGVSGPDATAQAEQVLTSVGLGESSGHLVEELSGGQQQRVAIARALAHPGTYLLADEPTTALDAGNRRRMMHLLLERAEGGSAVVVTTNDPDSLAGVTNEVLNLDDL
ncbi:ATP-binding cassette domain-containing protein [Luteipulveratus mongoliensis]|uniref:ABC transporter domain-containing protein n=1 Tax=Luteipulveratus mongoliensis TaxID=571913 RepID=A0A0K1JP02_9MICO|nr:ATP-binding cassette domain-containing protein [Luteipulveratus mongoliensis]AKU18449.1 hypothetical protein VV02_25660 [Luteipulveratus mongoliensis]